MKLRKTAYYCNPSVMWGERDKPGASFEPTGWRKFYLRIRYNMCIHILAMYYLHEMYAKSFLGEITGRPNKYLWLHASAHQRDFYLPIVSWYDLGTRSVCLCAPSCHISSCELIHSWPNLFRLLADTRNDLFTTKYKSENTMGTVYLFRALYSTDSICVLNKSSRCPL